MITEATYSLKTQTSLEQCDELIKVAIVLVLLDQVL